MAPRTPSPRRNRIAALAAVALLALAPAASAQRITPTDPAFATQWQLADNAAMGARSAWGTTTGGDVTVAVVDTGAQLDHPDLVGNLWTNPADGSHGYDFVNHDNDPSDDNGHGTNVAGIIGADGNNRLGVTGVAWNVKLMIVKVLGANGSGSESDVAAGIRYAVANGAKVINLSMAGPKDDPILESALTVARDAGVLVVAAAGNSGANLDTTPVYPASSPLDNVISVASTGISGRLAAGSGYGRTGVDISAPGENINSTALGSKYGTDSGTSQAAANVTGVLALELAAKPTASAQDLRTALFTGARASNLPVAFGALNAAGALHALTGAPTSTRAVKRSVRSRTRTTRTRVAARSASRSSARVSIA